MGLGLYKEGSGVSAARFFASRGARVLVTDLRDAAILAPSLQQLARFKNITYVLGRHRERDFKNAEIVFQNPSVPDTSPYLAIARKTGTQILNDWTIFLGSAHPKHLLAVTGTRGKSTTTMVLYDIVRRWKRGVRLAGNIGVSPLVFLDGYHGRPAYRTDRPVVAELSSWLLRGFRSARYGPAVAVVTNIMRDHQDKYPSVREYIADKSLIWRYQRREDIVVLNRDNLGTRAMGGQVSGTRFWFSLTPFAEENGCFIRDGAVVFRREGKEENLFQVSDWHLLGEHNLENLLAAVCAARAYGVPKNVIQKSVRAFRGIPSRLELVRTLRGVRFYNDTTATTPDAAIAALKTLHATPYTLPPRIILIAGGADKKLEYKEWAKMATRYCKAIIFLPGTATQKMKSALNTTHYQPLTTHHSLPTMPAAVRAAHEIAVKGDIILLSPGAASFGLFKNEFDRGDQFLKTIKQL